MDKSSKAILEASDTLLGKAMKDSITGFAGTCTCVSVYLEGDARVMLEAVGDRGVLQEWFDIARVEPNPHVVPSVNAVTFPTADGRTVTVRAGLVVAISPA